MGGSGLRAAPCQRIYTAAVELEDPSPTVVSDEDEEVPMAGRKPRPNDVITVENKSGRATVSRIAFEKIWKAKGYVIVAGPAASDTAKGGDSK